MCYVCILASLAMAGTLSLSPLPWNDIESNYDPKILYPWPNHFNSAPICPDGELKNKWGIYLNFEVLMGLKIQDLFFYVHRLNIM